jgi:hypothetical protein
MIVSQEYAKQNPGAGTAASPRLRFAGRPSPRKRGEGKAESSVADDNGWGEAIEDDD